MVTRFIVSTGEGKLEEGYTIDFEWIEGEFGDPFDMRGTSTLEIVVEGQSIVSRESSLRLSNVDRLQGGCEAGCVFPVFVALDRDEYSAFELSRVRILARGPLNDCPLLAASFE